MPVCAFEQAVQVAWCATPAAAAESCQCAAIAELHEAEASEGEAPLLLRGQPVRHPVGASAAVIAGGHEP